MAEPEPGKIDWTQVPVHPFLFAAHPMLFLYVKNIGLVAGSELWPPLAAVLAATAVAFGALRLVLRSSARAALVVTAVVFVFLQRILLYDIWYRVLELNLPLILGLLAVVVAVTVMCRRMTLAHWTRFLNVTGVVLVGLSVIQIAAFEVTSLHANRVLATHLARIDTPAGLAPTLGYAPDIYYIILDGYGRADVLGDLYGPEAGRLADHLRRKGFYVARESRSNYAQTLLSLASSLNMEYLSYLGEDRRILPQNRWPLIRLLRDNHVSQVLHSLGYMVVSYPSLYVTPQYLRADTVLMAPGDGGAGIFQIAVGEMTPLPGLARWLKAPASVLRHLPDGVEVHRGRTMYSLDNLGRFSEHTRPVFVFAHILCPHPPFLFGRAGPSPRPGALIADGTPSGAEADTGYYRAGYEDQVAYLNGRVREMVDRILANSKRPPIIIFQGDHGPGSRLVFGHGPGETTSVDLRERMSILNAYYLPAGGEKVLYPTITPVNTFRALFNYYFGAKYQRLPDRSFFSSLMAPYSFLEYAPGERAPRASEH